MVQWVGEGFAPPVFLRVAEGVDPYKEFLTSL